MISHSLLLLAALEPSGVILPAMLFVFTYVAIMAEQINRAIVALLGAGIAIVLGLISQDEAIAAIDFNTLALLVGTMIIVGIARTSGLFGYAAIRSAQIMRASPAGILLMLPLVTAVISAFLNNVTTVLLIVPVTLAICTELKVRAYPFLFAEVFASNIGGTATLIGDPPNILIGSAVSLSFNDFVENLTPVIIVVFVVQSLLMHAIWGRKMTADDSHRNRVMAMSASEAIKDTRLAVNSLLVIAAMIAAFVFAGPLKLEAGTIALVSGGVLMLLDTLPRHRDMHADAVTAAFNEVEWITIFFFVGLFVLVGVIENAGILDLLARQLVAATGGDAKVAAISILWGSAVLSAFVDNIPFVAAMIPMIKSMTPALGGEQAVLPLWWSLALGACLGGNGTLVGAAANLTVAGLADRNGIPFRFATFTLLAFPLMLIEIAICHVYVMWRYF